MIVDKIKQMILIFPNKWTHNVLITLNNIFNDKMGKIKLILLINVLLVISSVGKGSNMNQQIENFQFNENLSLNKIY